MRGKLGTGRLILSFMLAFALVFSISGLAVAEETPNKLVIGKSLKMQEGAELVDDFAFSFVARGIAINDVETSDLPALNMSALTFQESMAGTLTGGVRTIEMATGDILDGVVWPHAGVFTYRITEVNKSAEYNTDTEEFLFDAVEYELNVYVKNDGDNLVVNVVTAAIVDPETDEPGAKITDTIDPIEGTLTIPFTNQYKQIKGGGDDDLTGDELRFGKTVTGDYGNREKKFDFDVVVTLGALSTEATGSILIFDADDVLISSTPLAGNLTSVVSLADGEYAVFSRLEIGTTVSVIERDYSSENYTASVNGTDGNEWTELVTKATGNAAFVNDHEIVDPTGIIIGALPFAAIIAAVIGVVVMVSRKRDEIA